MGKGTVAIHEDIAAFLASHADEGYRAFQAKLIPNIDAATIVGVRTPELRKFAKGLARREDAGEFLAALPHGAFEENQLHSFVIAQERDFGKLVGEIERFLPFADNWATCDLLSPKAFRKHPPELRKQIRRWVEDAHTYTVRFGLGMLMSFYLDKGFQMEDLDLAAGVRREEYYVKMMAAWYFATALAKQYDAALPYLRQRRLDRWTHNKTIQKAVESYRITPEQKDELRSLRWKDCAKEEGV